jgi:hypothetical protein
MQVAGHALRGQLHWRTPITPRFILKQPSEIASPACCPPLASPAAKIDEKFGLALLLWRVALAAGNAPVRRAMRVDPTVALSHE